MKNKLGYLSVILALYLWQPMSQAQSYNTPITDPVRSQEILIDLIDRDGLMSGEMGESFLEYYDDYHPDQAVLASLRPLMEGLVITIVLGTWCGDSKEQLPRFLKLLDQLHYPTDEMLMIGVDSDKTARAFDVSGFDIERVPTFIFYKSDIEIGRIVESPEVSLEADLLKIVQ